MSRHDEAITVTITNWEKHQNACRSRSWVALSVNIFDDVRFRALSEPAKIVWFWLICHCGKVGHPAEITPRLVRDRADIYRTSTTHSALDQLQNQGLIEISVPTDKTDIIYTNVYIREPKKPVKKSTPKTPPKTPKKSTRRVPPDFALTDTLIAFASDRGMADWADQFEQFQDHEFKTARSDWAAAWRTWVRNWEKWGKAKSHGKGLTTESIQAYLERDNA